MIASLVENENYGALVELRQELTQANKKIT